MVVEYGSGHGKVVTSLGVLAGVHLRIVGFERDEWQYEYAQSVLKKAAEIGVSLQVKPS